jgi:acyl-CoA synthetase (AMP-forming)/AMP-acid ligase II
MIPADMPHRQVVTVLARAWCGAAASPEEIMRFVAGEVAHYKQIRRLEVIDAIPKSAAGKILRRMLRDSARRDDGIAGGVRAGGGG